MKNIWTFHHYSTPPSMSGLSRPHYFAKEIYKHGYNSVIFSSAYLHFTYENLIKSDEKYITHFEDNTETVFIKTKEYTDNDSKRVVNMFSFMIRLFSVTKSFAAENGKPDLIIASSPHPFTVIAGIFIAKRYKVPCVCEVRDLWPETIFTVNPKNKNSLWGRALVIFEYWLYKHSDAIIFTKEGSVDYIKEHKWDKEQGGKIDIKKCYYINNGIDIESFDASIENDRLDDEDLLDDSVFNVVYTGTIRRANNVENIIDAAVLLKDHKDIRFLVYGDGTESERIKNRINSENITNVRMKGYVNKKYIPYVLSKSSVNLLNYFPGDRTRGSSSNKLFEYMASGKPVISNVKWGYCIIDRYDFGISLEKSTPEALAEVILSIKKMNKDEYNRLCNNARKGSIEFDFKTLAVRLIDTIQECEKKENRNKHK